MTQMTSWRARREMCSINPYLRPPERLQKSDVDRPRALKCNRSSCNHRLLMGDWQKSYASFSGLGRYLDH